MKTLLQNEYIKILIPFLEARKEGYEKRGYIPTLELLINDLKESMNIEIDPKDAEDTAVEIQVEQSLLDKADKDNHENLCQGCESPLSGPDSDQPTTVCSNCV